MMIEGLNQVMTPVFGLGDRLVWLVDTNLCQQKPNADLLDELERTLKVIPQTSHLLLTTSKKPDGRLNTTKLLSKYAVVKDFSLIPPWKTDLIVAQVRQVAQAKKLRLTPKAVELLTESVGNNTRQLWNELEKLKIYWGDNQQPLDETTVAELVLCNTQNSLQLAAAIRDGKTDEALGLVTDLIYRNEPALKIVATLVGQFRTWTIVKLMQQSGNKDKVAIATAAGINNPNRLYFINQEIQNTNFHQLLATLPMLLELEYGLKSGGIALTVLPTKIIELCLIFN
jgi:DNA polymerase-3 subunit delta